MELRELLLFLHIVGAAGWIGGGLFGIFGFGRLATHGGDGAGSALEAIFEKASIYFTVMFLLVVIPGVLLVLSEDQWSWGDTFVWFGIGGIILSGAWQGLVAGKRDTAMVEAVKEGGAGRDAAVRTWRQTNWVDTVLLLVVVWAMVTKLGT